MTVTGRVASIVLDAADHTGLASFYAELGGWEVASTDDDWVTVRVAPGKDLAFQLAPDHVAPRWPGQERPQQMHLDLLVDGYEAAAERAVSLGAARLGEGARWVTLADPAGHPFDLCQQDGADGPMGLYAATFDVGDAGPVARFYAALLGMDVAYEGPEGALVAGDGPSVMFQQVGGYVPPRWPDPAHPQQGHLDIRVAGLDEGEARVLALGGTSLNASGEGFRVYADPAGHPFCLVT